MIPHAAAVYILADCWRTGVLRDGEEARSRELSAAMESGPHADEIYSLLRDAVLNRTEGRPTIASLHVWRAASLARRRVPA